MFLEVVLQVGMPVQHENPLDLGSGVLHLADRFLEDLVRQPIVTPIAEHSSVKEILINRGKLIFWFRLSCSITLA